ncbi:MAG: hypothetical protein WAU02_03305 [Candidatus Saccharimonadales bacterium]
MKAKNTTSKNKKTVLRNHNSRLRNLILLLILVMVLFLGYFLKDYNPKLQQEAEGFTKLKQDLVSLQKDFNKVDNGWQYREGCTGSGGVFDRDKATGCAVSISNKDVNKPEDLSKYLAMLNNYYPRVFQYLEKKGMSESYYVFESKSLPESNCSLEIVSDHLGDRDEPRYITFGCSHDAHYFYFPRTDR